MHTYMFVKMVVCKSGDLWRPPTLLASAGSLLFPLLYFLPAYQYFSVCSCVHLHFEDYILECAPWQKKEQLLEGAQNRTDFILGGM